METDLYIQMAEAVRRRDRALTGLKRWQETLDDAQEDMRIIAEKISMSTFDHTAATVEYAPAPTVEETAEPIEQEQEV